MNHQKFQLGFYGILLFLFQFFRFCSSAADQGEITAKDREAIRQFRLIGGKAIGGDNFRNSDEYIIRFLRDSDMDVNAANKKMEQYVQYRKDQKLDEVINEDMSDMRKWCGFQVQGRDNDGRPILLWPFGNCDLRRIILAGKQDKLNRYLQYLLETVAVEVRSSKTDSGKQVAQAVGIMDLNGFSLRQQGCLACLPFYTLLIKNLDTNYPQGLKSFNIINTPKVFTNVLDRVLTAAVPATKKVVHVYGHDKGEWKRELLKTIRPDQLPVILGGTDTRKY